MKRAARKPRNIKHEHATPNPIILQEEELLLAIIDKALASSTNSQTIGRNGEIPLRDFFSRYLPYTFRAVTGHFVTPDGFLSPQIDVMILDARYPLLAQNADGSVLAMLHSVIKIIEVKTRLSTRDLKKMWADCVEIMELASEIESNELGKWGSISTVAFAYRSSQGLDTLEAKYTQLCKPQSSALDIHVLRLPYEDYPPTIGFEFHFEPFFDAGDTVIDYEEVTRPYYNGLSDLYYRLVQDAYYTLETRGYSYGDVGRHIMDYMSWSTYRRYP